MGISSLGGRLGNMLSPFASLVVSSPWSKWYQTDWMVGGLVIFCLLNCVLTM